MRFISLLFFISFASNAQVENWGGPIERIENVLGFGYTCDRADRAELEFIDCQIPTLKVTNITDQMNFDQLSEELVFQEASRRNHQFVSCQRKLYDGLKDSVTRINLKKNAYLQFQNIREALGDRLQNKSAAEETVSNFQSSNFSEDRFNHRYNNWRQERLNRAQTNLSSIEGEINNLVSRIPLGNRKEVKEKITEILKTNPNITEEKFSEEFEKLITTLDSQVTASQGFFDGIKIPQGDGTNLYTIDDDMKLSLIRLGQVDNVVSALGMKERLSKGFVCRSRARYETGPTARKALEIPLYFAGAYGLGRLAARAGVGIISATSTAARAGMIGLDVMEGYRAFEETMDACFPDEFLAGSLDESCTGESEVSSIYQEADIASCVTTGVLGVGSVALVGGVRLWARTSQRTVARATPAVQAAPEEAAENVIVVTARRNRITAEARTIRTPEIAKNKMEMTATKIKGLTLVRKSASEEQLIKSLADKKMAKGIKAAFDRLHDKDALASYMNKLQDDTFQAMLRSGDSKLRQMANWGKLDKDTMLAVIKSRVEARGAEIVYITKLEGGLGTNAFNQRIGKGYLIDHGFPEGISHGTYTHLLQQDFTYETISKVSGKSHGDVIKFFGTEDGMRVWDNLYDGGGNTPTSPEFFQPFIMKDNVPLGFLKRDRTPQSIGKLQLPS